MEYPAYIHDILRCNGWNLSYYFIYISYYNIEPIPVASQSKT
jgi:hypothetical protein